MPEIAVAIPHYNRYDYLARCLSSLVAQSALISEIVVVDNASADESVARLQAEFPEVRLIANPSNLGFARASNQAIAASTAPFVLLLNNDTEVLPGALEAMLDFARNHPDAGAVGCRLLRSDGSSHRLPASIFSKLAWDLEHPARVPWLVGAALLLRREALDAIGGLDEAFFFYYEDLDLGLRLARAGWRSYYTPGARIVHHEKASTATARPMALVQLYRGRLLLAGRYYRWALGLTRLWMRLTFPLALAMAKRKGADGQALLEASGEIRALLRSETV